MQSAIRRANIAARMKIETGSVVTIAYDICTEDGEIVESSEISGPVTFVQGKGAPAAKA